MIEAISFKAAHQHLNQEEKHTFLLIKSKDASIFS